MTHNQNVVLDCLSVNGDGKTLLKEVAEALDSATEIREIDLQKSYMYHYSDTDRQDGRMAFMEFIPGDEYIKQDPKTGTFNVQVPHITVGYNELPEDLIDEIRENPQENGLIFTFDEDGDISKGLVVSSFLFKTLSARIPGLDMSSPMGSMHLATLIGDTENEDAYKFFAVVRKQGDAGKLIAVFKDDPERKELTGLVNRVLEKPCCVTGIEATQKGLSFIVTYYDEAEEVMSDEFTELGYTPAFKVQISDSGYSKDTVTAILLTEQEEVIELKSVEIGEDISADMDNLKKVHLKAAETLTDRSSYVQYKELEEVVGRISDVIAKSPEKLGKKTTASVLDAARDIASRRRELRLSKMDLLDLGLRSLFNIYRQESSYKQEIISRLSGDLIIAA